LPLLQLSNKKPLKMKNLIAITVAVLLMGISSFAQESPFQNRVSIGPRLGFNSSSFGSNDLNTNMRIAPTLGIMFLYSQHENFGISADLMYSPMGAHISRNGNGEAADLTTKLHYLHLPAMGVYFFNFGTPTIKPKAGLGPYVSFLANSSETIEGTEVFTGRNFSSWDFGLNGMVGVNFLVTPALWLNADLRYAHGLANVNATEASDISMRNRLFSITVGLGFSLERMLRE
jgi:opacity protein-like surface antigen